MAGVWKVIRRPWSWPSADISVPGTTWSSWGNEDHTEAESARSQPSPTILTENKEIKSYYRMRGDDDLAHTCYDLNNII